MNKGDRTNQNVIDIREYRWGDRSERYTSPVPQKYTLVLVSESQEFIRQQPSRPTVADEMVGELWTMVGLFTFIAGIVWICLAIG